MPDGRVHTEAHHSLKSIDEPLIYTFNANAFGIMKSVKHTGSFTISFWMYNDDWTKPFGEQLIGNYMIKGFGIFNQPHVTPFIAIPLPDSIDNHQYLNAKYYEKKGCCWILTQDNFNNENLFNLIMETIKNKNKLENIRENMKKNYNKNVYSNIENEIKEFI